MSSLRPARDDEIARLWPAVKAARLFASAAEFSAYRDAGPWRVRASDAGEAMVLDEWREGQNLLWIKGRWGSASRTSEAIEHALSVARGQGYVRVLSPLVATDEFAPYLDAGMTVVESLVALQGLVESLSATEPAGVSIRPGSPADIEDLLSIDRACFDAFWGYGPGEFRTVLARERLAVAMVDGGIVGYSTLSVYGRSATLGRIAVAPEARARGVARTMLAEQAAHAARRGAHAVVLCTQEGNAGARALYQRCGMIELPVRYALGAAG